MAAQGNRMHLTSAYARNGLALTNGSETHGRKARCTDRRWPQSLLVKPRRDEAFGRFREASERPQARV
jgi:hypothetical protein